MNRAKEARGLHAVVRRITGWSHGKFGEWDQLTDEQREWWDGQVAFVLGLYADVAPIAVDWGLETA